jgi:integrase
MPLADIAIRNAKPQEKPVKLFDTGGLYLLVNPNGSRWWRLKFRYGGKEKLISLGTYPETTLKAARERRDEARVMLAQGINPSAKRQATKAAPAESFEAIAREWFAKFSPGWAKGHSEKIIRRLERDVFPWIGARPLRDIAAPELLSVLRRIEARGALDTAHRAHQNCGQVFRYAVATGRAERDPSADLRGALPPVRKGHFAAIVEPAEVGALLRAISGYRGSVVTLCALRLAPLVFVRPGELRQAEWAEFDLDRAEWRIPAERMKAREEHIVPLARQAVAVLRELHPLTGLGRFVFPSARTDTRPMSNNAVLSALRRMGYGSDEMTGHGFRAMARTVLDEVLGFRVDIIEHQLAHSVKDPLGRAYNRTKHLDERRRMMQAWADYLEALEAGAKILRFPEKPAG